MINKYDAVWVSHSSIGDFLKCPRAYYLRNVYRNDQGRKVNITNPHLALGIAVHDTVEGLLQYKAEERFKKPLVETFEENWKKVSGKFGGFKSDAQEQEFKERAKLMIERVDKNRGPLINKAIKLKEHNNNMPPNFYLSEPDNIILSGKIDWIEYVPQDDSIKVIDFKTGQREESKDSLQLPIYALLLSNLQSRKLSGVAYWYLERDNEPTSVELPDIANSHQRVLTEALKVKQARESGIFKCKRGEQGCFACEPFEKVLRGEANFVTVDHDRRTEIYYI